MVWAALLAAFAIGSTQECPVELFRITRSTNDNVVVYEIDGAAADAGATVRVSWILYGEGGRREDLTPLERMLAFGFELSREPDGMTLTLRADRARSISLQPLHGCWRAFRLIAGRRALLDRIHVQVREQFPLPSVDWIDVFGTDAEDGGAVSERIVPE